VLEEQRTLRTAASHAGQAERFPAPTPWQRATRPANSKLYVTKYLTTPIDVVCFEYVS